MRLYQKATMLCDYRCLLETTKHICEGDGQHNRDIMTSLRLRRLSTAAASEIAWLHAIMEPVGMHRSWSWWCQVQFNGNPFLFFFSHSLIPPVWFNTSNEIILHGIFKAIASADVLETVINDTLKYLICFVWMISLVCGPPNYHYCSGSVLTIFFSFLQRVPPVSVSVTTSLILSARDVDVVLSTFKSTPVLPVATLPLRPVLVSNFFFLLLWQVGQVSSSNSHFLF